MISSLYCGGKIKSMESLRASSIILGISIPRRGLDSSIHGFVLISISQTLNY